MKTITSAKYRRFITSAKYRRFKKAYEVAVKTGDQLFIFEGRGFLTTHAAYLLEYMARRFAA